MEAAGRYLKYPCVLRDDDVLNIGHRPWVAPQNYMLMIYPGIDSLTLQLYCQRLDLKIPAMYEEFLQAVNGGFFFNMWLAGNPRSTLRCHDLWTAATSWIGEYNVPKDYFHFGGRHLSASKNVAYFINGNNHIVCVKGKKQVIGQWMSFTDFLRDELKASETLEEELHPAKWDV
jgi:hypothetical protein